MKTYQVLFFSVPHLVLLAWGLNYFSSQWDSSIEPQQSANHLISVKTLDITIDTIVLESTVFTYDNFDSCDPNCLLSILNKDKSEKLELFFYPGRNNNVASYFRVKKIDNTNEHYQTSECSNFKSSFKISLGITKDSLQSILEDKSYLPYSSEINDTLTVNISNESVPFKDQLAKFNYPLYTAKFIFKDKKLVEFEMGFLYP